MEGSKYHIVLFGGQEYSGDDKFTIHEPPAYRSVYVSNVQIDETTGHLIVTLSDGTTIDSGYVRGSQGIQGVPGANGKDGKDGKDGHSPVVTATKVGKTTTIKVDGVAIATILDGTGDGSGTPGATFTPSVSEDGVISWTNDGGFENPSPVNIKGPAGARGATGASGKTPVKGTDYFTEADKTEMVNAVLAALPNGDESTYGSE